MSTGASLPEGWVRKDKYYVQHTSGATICKCFVDGMPAYELWIAGKLRLVGDNLDDTLKAWQGLAADERPRT